MLSLSVSFPLASLSLPLSIPLLKWIGSSARRVTTHCSNPATGATCYYATMAELIVPNTPASPSLSPRVAARASFSRRCSELTVSLGSLRALYNNGLAHRAEPSRGARSEAPPVLNIRDNTRGPPVERQPTSWGVVGSPLAGSLKFERTISLLSMVVAVFAVSRLDKRRNYGHGTAVSHVNDAFHSGGKRQVSRHPEMRFRLWKLSDFPRRRKSPANDTSLTISGKKMNFENILPSNRTEAKKRCSEVTLILTEESRRILISKIQKYFMQRN